MCSLQIRGEPFQERMASCKTWLMLWWKDVYWGGAKQNVRNLFRRYEPNICFSGRQKSRIRSEANQAEWGCQSSEGGGNKSTEKKGYWHLTVLLFYQTGSSSILSSSTRPPWYWQGGGAEERLLTGCCRKNVLPDANLQLQCCPGPGFWWQEKELEAKQMDRTFGGNWSKHKRQFLQTHRCENVINNQNKWHSDNMTAERGWHFIDILTNWTLTRDLTELEIKQGHCSFPNKMISMQGVDACSNNFINETIQGFSDVN